MNRVTSGEGYRISLPGSVFRPQSGRYTYWHRGQTLEIFYSWACVWLCSFS